MDGLVIGVCAVLTTSVELLRMSSFGVIRITTQKIVTTPESVNVI